MSEQTLPSPPPMPGLFAPLRRWGAAFDRWLVDRLAGAGRWVDTPFGLTALFAAILAGLAIYSFGVAGFDLSRFVTGDALYPVQVQHFPVLAFRPPPSNELFPDVLVHLALGPFIADPLWQKIVAGWILYAGMIFAIAWYKGPLAAGLVAGILALTGFGFLDSTSHYTLPLTLLVFQVVRQRFWNGAVLFVIVFSDLLVLLPLIVLLLSEEENKWWPERIAIIALAYCGNAFYSEFSESLMKITLLLPAFGVAALAAKYFGLLRSFAIALAGILPLMGVLGLGAIRYDVAVAACFVLVALPMAPKRGLDWRVLALPVVALGIFTTTASAERLDLHNAQYDCLLDLLADRGITVLAADHWVAKPLYFAALARGQELTITQTDFAEGDSSNWMAPHAFAGAPTPHAVKSDTICSYIAETNAFCSQADVAPVVKAEKVCNGLEFYTYSQNMPLHYQPPAGNKLQSVLRNLSAYVSKVI